MSWTEFETQRLKELHAENKWFFSEIAEKLKRKPAGVRWKAKSLGLVVSSEVRSKMGVWNSKHIYLRQEVMTYFLDHSMSECMKEFNLTKSNLKSLMCVSYKDPSLAHLRKDKRVHRGWSQEEKLILIQSAGIQSRKWIANKLKRGTYHSVKEELSRLNSNSRYMNGLPLRWFNQICPDQEVYHFRVKAGPSSQCVECRVLMVPWVEAERAIKWKRVDPVYRSAIRSMAKFQRWIHGTNNDIAIKRKLKRILNQGDS